MAKQKLFTLLNITVMFGHNLTAPYIRHTLNKVLLEADAFLHQRPRFKSFLSLYISMVPIFSCAKPNSELFHGSHSSASTDQLGHKHMAAELPTPTYSL